MQAKSARLHSIARDEELELAVMPTSLAIKTLVCLPEYTVEDSSSF